MKIQHFLWSIVAVTLIYSCFAAEYEFENKSSLDTSLGDIFKSISQIVKGLLQSIAERPDAKYYMNYINEIILGLPLQLSAIRLNDACAAVLAEDVIKPNPEDVPEIDDIAIQLRTSCNIREYPLQQLASIVDDPDFDVDKSVVIAASGWRTNANQTDAMIDTLAKAYNCRNDTNFLVINDGRYIQTLYTWSALNTKIIGQYVAEALVNLTQVVPLENFHLIGHSLGAQMVGEVARHFHRLTDKQIPHVTGLDPAGPCFNYGQKVATLSAGDAAYVDIIHTNPGAEGQLLATGDADFFVGGHLLLQNGCSNSSCSHGRSWHYYGESVYPGNENNFLSKRCDTVYNLQRGRCVGAEYPMGYAVPRYLKGQFILEINASEPYGKNYSSTSYTSPSSECGACEE